MERRRATRYPLHAPVVFQWMDGEERNQQGGGFTRDISTCGVFVLCEAPPPEAVGIALEILLPPFAADTPGLRLKGKGEVVRAEQTQPMCGFAVVSDLDLPQSRDVGEAN